MSRSLESHAMIHCAYFFAARMPGTEILSFTRTSLTVRSLGELEEEMGRFEELLGHVARGAHDVLLDLRSEPVLEDAELARAYRERCASLMGGFRRGVVLSSRPDEWSHLESTPPYPGTEVRLLTDESEAFDWFEKS